MTRTQTRLLTIGIPHPAASIIDLSERHPLPLPIGKDNENLVCGACGTVVLAGWSRSSTAERLVVDSQMLIRCSKCQAYNVVPTARLAEEPREALAMVHNRLKRPLPAQLIGRRKCGTPLWNRADDWPPVDFVVIAISDTDFGMWAAVLKRAFEPFFAMTKVREFEQSVWLLESSRCRQPPISSGLPSSAIGGTADRKRVHSSE